MFNAEQCQLNLKTSNMLICWEPSFRSFGLSRRPCDEGIEIRPRKVQIARRNLFKMGGIGLAALLAGVMKPKPAYAQFYPMFS